MRLRFLIFFLFLSSIISAQVPVSMSSSEILHAIKKLKVAGSVLYIAAHPDDENTRLLAYLAKEKMYRTGYLSLTRGDGGQNLIGEEQGIELGLIRTQELLAARRIDGAEQFFTRAYDFGYSKNTEEALRIWGKEKILSDVVWVIRQFQPDIIITRFPPDQRAGHGHHSASAVLAREAFEAAADSTRFTDHFQYGVFPWKAKRLMWNTFNFGSSNTISKDQFSLDVGGYNPLIGKSYGEIASESRSQHKSQGFGVPRQRGQQMEYFSPVVGESWKTDFMEGVDVSWSRIDKSKKIEAEILQIEQAYRFDLPSASVPALVDLYKKVEAMPVGYWRDQKLKEIKQLIELTSGMYFECSTAEPHAVLGDTLHLQITVINRNGLPVTLKEVKLQQLPSVLTLSDKVLEKNVSVREKMDIRIPETFPLSNPFWLEKEPNGAYQITDQQLIGVADSRPALEALFTIVIHGQAFSFSKQVQYKFTDPVKGEIYWPLAVVPPLSLEVQPKVLLEKNKSFGEATIAVRSFSAIPVSGITLGFKGSNKSERLNLSNFSTDSFLTAGREWNIPLPVKKELATPIMQADVALPSSLLSESYHEILHDHIPRIVYFDKPAIKALQVDVKTVGKKVGYIRGAGDKVPEALVEMGYELVFLEEKDMKPELLKSFDAIMTGVRAYNVHQWLGNVHPVLMNYIKHGGVLVVQYNTSSQIGPLKSRIAPYPLTISRNRVSEETADVTLLLPNHPLMQFPNKISTDDFKNWVQERSVYEAESADTSFLSLLSMHDQGEQERKGSLLVAEYGKGTFIYTGLALFRQLPAGVPGAFRLLANLLAGGRNDKRKIK